MVALCTFNDRLDLRHQALYNSVTNTTATATGHSHLWTLAEMVGLLALSVCTWLATAFTCVIVPAVRLQSQSTNLCLPCSALLSLIHI